jgi:DNA/RNA endonuclease YhcR with UshA esterase domain
VSRLTSTRSLLLAVIVVSGCQTAAVSEPAEIATVSIEEARGMSMGEPVRVFGTVTVPSGAFASSISSGFALQDDTAGIYVLDSNHAFKLGGRVKVTGKRGAEFGQVNIILESAEKLTGSGTVDPRPVKTGNAGEAEEGILIRVEGYVTQTKSDPPYGFKAFIDDGSGEFQIFVNASTGLVENARDWKVGDFVSVIGFSGQYENTYEIMPRVLSDITIGAGAALEIIRGGKK